LKKDDLCRSRTGESEPAALFGFSSVWRAYLACRRRKRGTAQAQRYEMAVLDQVENTAWALQQRCFSPSRSLCFIARQPKAREIHAAAFADRVVHHLLVPHLEALFEPVFIHDLYSNRKNKGTHAAVDRLQSFMWSLTGDGQAAWFLQLDIRNFFNSIDRRRLFGLVRHRVEKSRPGQFSLTPTPLLGGEGFDSREDSGRLQEELLWLTRRLLTGNPADTAIRQGRPEDFARVPPYKRLANAPPEKGLPIGNLTSQFFANVYLNELDQFVKHQLKCRHYLRYVDDFILLHHDPAQLLVWRQAIADFLQTRMELVLKDLPEPRPVGDGANFLGYIVRPHYRLVRRRVVGNLRAKLDALARIAAPGSGIVCLDTAQRETLRATLASYLGHFRHARHHRLTAALWCRYPWLGEWFGFNGQRLIPRWEPRRVNSLLGQWRYFSSQWPEAWVLMQVGNRLQAFNEHAVQIVNLFGYPLDRDSRIHFSASLSIRFRSREKWLKKLRSSRQAYCLVVEEGYLPGGMRRRALQMLFQP